MNLFTDISYTDQKPKKLLSRGASFKSVLGSHEHGKWCPGHHQKNNHLWGGRQVLVFSFMTAWPFLPGVSRSTSRNRSQDTECQSQITSWKGRFSLLWNVPKNHVLFWSVTHPKKYQGQVPKIKPSRCCYSPKRWIPGIYDKNTLHWP